MKRLARAWTLCCMLVLTAALASAGFARSAAATQEIAARLGDARIHFISQGQGPDAVVFIHGWSCDASFWDAQMAALGSTHRVIALDLIGCGSSSAPHAEYTQELFAQSLGAVLDAAGVKRALLVGHSMGLSVAKRYIDAHPERVAGLFIVDGAYMDLPKDAAQAQIFRDMVGAPGMDTDPGWRAFVAGFVRPMLSKETLPAARRKILSTMQGSPRQAARDAFLHFLEPGAWGDSPVDLPVHAVYAASLNKGLGVRDYLSTVFPRLEYEEWNRCGHFIMFDQPERLNRAIARFAGQTLR